MSGAGTASGGMANGGTAGVPGTSGGQQAGAGASGSGAIGGGSRATPDTIFTSPKMPHCVWEGELQHQIQGVLNGEAVDIHALAMASDLSGARFRTFVFESNFVYPLVLTWTEQPREDHPIPISGETLLMRGDQPFAGQTFCITAGEFGSRNAQERADARELLFHISGARAGDCFGKEVPVELFGCILASGSYFPTSLTVDFPVDPSRPSIDPGKALEDLTDQERAELCDWTAFMVGGYGETTDCRPIGGSSATNYSDRAQCLAAVFSRVCPKVTVQDHINCIVAEAPTRGCVYPSDACFATAGICG